MMKSNYKFLLYIPSLYLILISNPLFALKYFPENKSSKIVMGNFDEYEEETRHISAIKEVNIIYQDLKTKFDSLKYYQSTGNKVMQLRYQILIADQLRETGNYKEGLLYYNEASKLADSFQFLQYTYHIEHGISEVYYELYFHKKDYRYLDSTSKYAQAVFRKQSLILDSCIISENYNVLGAIQIQKGNADSAVLLLNKALSFHHMEEASLPILANLSYAYYLKGDLEKALRDVQSCYLESIHSNNLVFMGICLDNMHLYYSKIGDSIKAKEVKSKRTQLSRENKIEIRNILAKNLFLKHENDQSDSYILNLQSESYYLVKINQVLTYTSIAAVLLLLFVLISLLQSRKLRKSNQELYKSYQISSQLELEKKELEVKNKDSEANILRIELENKKCALNEKLLTQADFNEFMREVEHDVQNGIKESDKEKQKKILSGISQKIRNNQNKDWLEEYQLLFNAAASSFINKLNKKHSGLSENDNRLSYLIATGLSSKEIAQILHKTYRAIEMARHRLRHKMDLKSADNIYQYLQNFLR